MIEDDDDLAIEKANAAAAAAAKADQAHSYQEIVDGMKAVRARIDFINATYHHNYSPQSELVGLVGAYRVVQVLARRFLRATDWPGHEVADETKLLWEQQWYEQYCNAVVEISKAMQTAVANGELTLRSPLTRIALDEKRLGAWLGEDIAASMATAFKKVYPRAKRIEHPASVHRPARTTYTEVKRLDIATGRWPDDVVLPPGVAYIADFASWASAAGIANSDEVIALLSDARAATLAASMPVSVIPHISALAEKKVIKHKLRFNALDAPIQKAIKAAESQVLALVFLKLKDLALAEERPFTGQLEDGEPLYTADNGKVTKLTKKALGQRLKRLTEADR